MMRRGNSAALTGRTCPMELGPLDAVTEADLERELEWVRHKAADGRTGLFGPASVTWRVDREAAVFLGAGRALLLQLAHPWVAAAIAQHSRSMADPIGRFHRTFAYVFTMVFGTLGQALSAAQALHRRHAMIDGVLPERAGPFASGSPYKANDAAALRWVHATLIDSALIAYGLLRPPLSDDECEQYYAESRLFAALFGIPQSVLPQSWAGFADYVAEMLRSDILVVSQTARRVAAELFSGAGTGWRIPRWYNAVTTRQMPPRLRQDFGLSYGPSEHRSAERALAVLRHIRFFTPAALRYVGPYHEADARLAGRARSGLVTKALNRFWIGRASMPFADSAFAGTDRDMQQQSLRHAARHKG
jgi:uncharacterized protein (DUF2236 family)